MNKLQTTCFNHLNKYDLSPQAITTSKLWEKDHMYYSSNFMMSEKNQNALTNSTDQFLKRKSTNLDQVSPRNFLYNKPVENPDFLNHDNDNLYRSSYNDMSNKLPKLLNKHFIPKYQGFVPRMNSENPIEKTVQKLQKEQIKIFDFNRFQKIRNGSNIVNDFANFKEDKFAVSRSLEKHSFTKKLRESGYTNNVATFDKTGWIPHVSHHSDMTRTEYRIHINPSKALHFKSPLFSSGKFKKKELVYKHT